MVKTIKSLSTENRIVLLLVIVIGIVAVSGLVSYNRLSGIIGSVQSDLRPDQRLLVMKEVLTDISDAEISVKTYTLTNNEQYLEAFYLSVNHTGILLDRLRRFDQEDAFFIAQVDSLESLVKLKFNVLEDLISIQNNGLGKQALENFAQQIETKPSRGAEGDTKTAQDKNLWDRIFGKPEGTKELSEKDKLSLAEINKQLASAKKVEELKEKELKEKELRLITEDRNIMIRLRSVMAILEKQERDRLAQMALIAEQKTRETNYFIAIFCLAAGLLLVLTTATILKFVKNNNRYKKALNKAKEQALELAKAKEKFMANMSHEIRTPMNAISGFTDQLKKTKLNDKQKSQLKMISNSTKHLLQIVNDVLDYTKLDAGKLRLVKKSFPIKPVLDEVIEMVHGLAERKGIEVKYLLSVEFPKFIVADPLRIKQALINLTTNAIKFTPKGKVQVEAYAETREEGEMLVLKVQDTGIGMEPEDLQRVFQEFEQAGPSSSKELGGTGLGMSITKQLVDLHDGTIEIESESGKGTSIYMVIPLVEGDKNELEREEDAGKIQLTGLNILIVDDEPYNRALLKAIFSSHDVSIIEAENGEKAIEQLEANPKIDIVLMDMRMPVLGGIEATRKIRSSEKPYEQVPILALSAAGTREDLLQYEAEGMQGYVPKPFKENQLLTKVAESLKLDIAVDEMDDEMNQSEDALYNIEGLVALSGNDNSFVVEMLEGFLKGNSESLSQLEVFVEEKDYEGVRDAAHRMCGPCSHLEAKELYQHCKKIENLSIEKGDWEQIAEEYNKAKNAYEALEKEILEDLEELK